MAERCTQPDHTADPVVFGECPCRRPQQLTLPRFVPSSWFVVPTEQPWETTLSDDTEPGDLG